jgi:hypothetical protein
MGVKPGLSLRLRMFENGVLRGIFELEEGQEDGEDFVMRTS